LADSLDGLVCASHPTALLVATQKPDDSFELGCEAQCRETEILADFPRLQPLIDLRAMTQEMAALKDALQLTRDLLDAVRNEPQPRLKGELQSWITHTQIPASSRATTRNRKAPSSPTLAAHSISPATTAGSHSPES
jgi:hypothetical protein